MYTYTCVHDKHVCCSHSIFATYCRPRNLWICFYTLIATLTSSMCPIGSAGKQWYQKPTVPIHTTYTVYTVVVRPCTWQFQTAPSVLHLYVNIRACFCHGQNPAWHSTSDKHWNIPHRGQTHRQLKQTFSNVAEGENIPPSTLRNA